ncbi:MAG: MFS transporter [Bacteroidaceae bacterium]|nr:MFS transporter [Bacteroidaceae bacterium]
MKNTKQSPWSWIPTLYFAQGLPYVAVMTISVIMYKRLGISNTDIALYTSWLYLPWVIKPFWSPFIDIFKTKRWWVVTMQMLVGAGLAGIALTIPMPNFFQLSLAVFWLVAFSSATHDIAADGFYMLALDTHEQAMYVGIRSTFYRVATIVGQGLLIILAGFLEVWTGVDPVQIKIDASPEYTNELVMPSATYDLAGSTDTTTTYFVTTPAVSQLSTTVAAADISKVTKLEEQVAAYNLENGFVASTTTTLSAAEKREEEKGICAFVKNTFGEKRAEVTSTTVPNIGIVKVCISKKPEADEEIVLNTALSRGDKSISIVQGERIVFTEDNWQKPAYVIVQVDPKLRHATSTTFKGVSGNIPVAWSVTFFVLAGFFIAVCLYHKYILPKPSSDHGAAVEDEKSVSAIFHAFFTTFKTFFQKKQAWVAILFMLLYRLPEAQLVKLINPFLLDSADKGGLGLTTGQVGLVYGTIGVLGLTLGGIIGGIVAAKHGLKRWLWPMAWSISLTCVTFVYLSFVQPESLIVINLCVFIEQFGYGFGFTAYMLYMIYFSEGEYKTAHYAICTAFMALGMMLPGMMAGWLQELIGYNHFFVWVMICCSFTILVCAFVKIDPSYGVKKEEETPEIPETIEK